MLYSMLFIFILISNSIELCRAQSYYVDTFAIVTGPRAVRHDPTFQNVYFDSGDTAAVIYKTSVNGGSSSAFASGFNVPLDMCFDPDGNLYVADNSNHRIVKVTQAGAGSVVPGLSLSFPWSCVFHSTGHLYIVDRGNNRIVSRSPANVVSVVSVSPATTFLGTSRITVDKQDNIYMTESSARISKISPSQQIIIIAGSSTTGYRDGPTASALFTELHGIAYDSNYDAIYVAEGSGNVGYGGTIRSIKSGQVATIAGLSGSWAYVDGYGTAARFNYPLAISLDQFGNILVADLNNNRIRKIYVCPGTSYTDVTSKTCFCDAGYELFNGTCQACSSGKYKPSSGKSCLSCPANASCNTTSFLCDIGYAVNTTHTGCSPCPIGQESNSQRTGCVNCVSGSTYRNALVTSCISCPGNSVCSNTTSFTCNVGYILNATQTGCTVCTANQEANNERTACSTCDPVMQYFSNATKTCMPCLYGSVCDGVSYTCASGFIRNSSADGCIACPANQATNSDKTACVSCSGSQFISSSLKLCTSCPIGATCNGVSFTCNAGYEPTLDGLGCSLCQEGYSKASSGNVVCTQCAVGTESAVDKFSCVTCGTGKYRPSTSINNRCVPCPQGASCNATTLTCNPGFIVNGDLCQQCPLGQDSSNGAICQNCGTGLFKPSQNYATCITCPSGSSNCAGSSITCPTGYYYDSNVQCKRNDTYFALMQTGTSTASTVTSFVTVTQTSTSTSNRFNTETQYFTQTTVSTVTVTQNSQSIINGTPVIQNQNNFATVTVSDVQTVTESVNAGSSAPQAQSANSVTLDFIGTLPISPLVLTGISFGAGFFIMLILALVCCRKSSVKRRDDDFDGVPGMNTTMNTTSQRTFTNNSMTR